MENPLKLRPPFCFSSESQIYFDFTAENGFSLDVVGVRIIKVAVKQHNCMIIEDEELGIVAGSIPIVEGGRFGNDVCQMTAVSGGHDGHGVAPVVTGVIERRLNEDSGTGVAYDAGSAIEAADARQDAGEGELFRLAPAFAHIVGVGYIHRSPLASR